MKIAFFIDNNPISSVDLSRISEGNPGIGGTEFIIVALSYFLSQQKHSNIQITLYANGPLDKLPAGLYAKQVQSFDDAIKSALYDGNDILVINHCSYTFKLDTLKSLEETNAKVVVWIHNFLESKIISFYNNLSCVKRIVYVGRELYDAYRDHDAFEKSDFIYNGFNFEKAVNAAKFNRGSRTNEVTYIGSLVYGKGFDVLARVWPKVVKEVPDAHLNVIGGGQLYNRNLKMGKYGIADDAYEKSFIKYLLDTNGGILPSVTFHGILGVEKEEILNKTKVGVPNPSGASETFGYTAVEMQAFGAMVTTKLCPGYIDTVCDLKNLYKKEKHLGQEIIKLLKTNNLNKNQDTILDCLQQKFSFEVVCHKWIELFRAVYKNEKMQPYTEIPNIKYNNKRLREINRRLRKNLPLGKYLPPVEIFETIITKIRFHLRNGIL